jgi:hypothetical protein
MIVRFSWGEIRNPNFAGCIFNRLVAKSDISGTETSTAVSRLYN